MKIKDLLFLLLILCMAGVTQAQSTVSGVVTYYHNSHQGNKPDLGAVVMLVDTTKLESFDSKLLKDYTYARGFRQVYPGTLERYNTALAETKRTEGKKRFQAEHEKAKEELADAQKDLDMIKAELTGFGAETEEKWEALDMKTQVMLKQINADNSQKKTIDANGGYTFNVAPGTYYVYIISKNRQRLSFTEVNGNIYLKKVQVGENESKDVSHNFEI